MKRLIWLILVVMLMSGCAYYGETCIRLETDKAKAYIKVPLEVEGIDTILVRKTIFYIGKKNPFTDINSN